MALGVVQMNATRDRPTTQRKRRAPASSSPSPPKPAKRPATRRADNGTSAGTAAQWLNPLPVPPTHERPGWQLFGWGGSDSGQLGMDEEVLEISVPKPRRNRYVENLSREGAFGEKEAGLESIAAGGMHTVFIDETGTVWTCGSNDNSELGRTTITVTDGARTIEVDEATSIPFHVPAPIQSLRDEGFRAVKVAAGDCITVVLDGKGQLRAWGTYRTSNGPLGFSPRVKQQYTPVAISGTAGLEFAAVAAGDNHILLLTVKGEVYTAGSGEFMQLGRRVLQRHLVKGTVPERVVLQSRARKAVVVGAGADHSFAVDEEGTVWGWGLNAHGQTGTGVGTGRREDRIVPAPLAVIGLCKADLGGATVVQVAGGSQHTLFLVSDGRVYACGNYEDGQLGVADSVETLRARYPGGFVPEPVLVRFPEDDDPVVGVACGTHNNLAVTAGGAMYGWGRDTTGQVGTGEDVRTPRMIVRRTGGSWSAKAVSCGGQHSLGLLQKKT